MKQTLANSLIQDWTLIGLKPMHRAILRQAVQSHVTGLLESEIEISWRTWDYQLEAEQIGLNGRPVWDAMRSAGVVVIDCDALHSMLTGLTVSEREEIAILARPAEQIRLLWSWSFRGRLDLSWCTELAFAGVLHDVQSVGHWARVCVNRGPVRASQTNALISGIELPPLK